MLTEFLTGLRDLIWVSAMILGVMSVEQTSGLLAAVGTLIVVCLAYLLPAIGRVLQGEGSTWVLPPAVPLTVNSMVDMAWETIETNGFHEDDVHQLLPSHPQAQIAALAPIVLALAQAVEAIRKPQQGGVTNALARLAARSVQTNEQGLDVMVMLENPEWPFDNQEWPGDQLGGSLTQIICRLMLIVSEAAEAIEAVLKSDWEEFGVENADMMLRMGDMIKAYNLVALRTRRPPIDLEAVIRAKNERNKQRGHKHGDKTA